MEKTIKSVQMYTELISVPIRVTKDLYMYFPIYSLVDDREIFTGVFAMTHQLKSLAKASKNFQIRSLYDPLEKNLREDLVETLKHNHQIRIQLLTKLRHFYDEEL